MVDSTLMHLPHRRRQLEDKLEPFRHTDGLLGQLPIMLLPELCVVLLYVTIVGVL